MIEPKKITREEANTIIADWHNSDKPHKQVVCMWRGQWYDVRELSEQEIMQFAVKMTGEKNLKVGDIKIGSL